MESTVPVNSIEVQIDNFLEQFKKRSSFSKTSDNVDLQRACYDTFDDTDTHSLSSSYMTPMIQNLQHQSSSLSSCASAQTAILLNSYHSTGSSANNMQASLSQLNGVSTLLSQSFNESISSKSDHVLTVADVADLLHPQYAIITGARTPDGCSFLTFPDRNNFHTLSDDDYQKLIYYLTSVPSLQDQDMGFNIIIDRRSDKWTSVRSVLLRIAAYFPALINVVFVLRPVGFFQKAISEVSAKFFKEDFRFRLVVCSSLEELHSHVPVSQLTLEYGGSLFYSHHDWIQQRISLEKFSNITQQVSSNLANFIRIIQETEFPNSVDATQNLLDSQGVQYSQLKEEILAATSHGESLLEDIRAKDEVKREFSERTGNISSIERLLVQIEETERRFDDCWRFHLARLRQCLELRRFEQDFRELQINFAAHMNTISDMSEIGETVVRMDFLIEEYKDFEHRFRVDANRAEDVIASGRLLISQAACMAEIIGPKCEELTRIRDIIKERLEKRLDILTKSKDLMEKIEKANLWCAKGIELLTMQRIEKCSSSVDIAEKSLQEIIQFITSANDFDSREFRSILEERSIPETKPLVIQVLQRIDDVSMMCDKRIVSLKQLTLPRPIQTVIPEPAIPITSQRKVDGATKRSSSEKGAIDSGISICSDNSNPQKTDDESRRLKQGHVLDELLETERVYVAEMKAILKGYKDQMRSAEMESLVPPQLQGKDEVLFGNLQDLYSFHSDVFLKDLENCISTTELVALCFVQRRDTFYRLYSYYCQNIPRSEQLRETLVDTHLFLQECQKRLGHKLPLAAYLLKPVQRITKYQLLLKDLLRYSDNGTCSREIQKALDCMLIVLKCVNDSMHQIAITGFPADLAQQGELLLQDSFQVWTDSKKDLRLRLKTQQRHIFLYQKAILFCKHASKTGHNKSTYQYKHYVKMSQIGLTESVRGDPKRFEVWLQGRQEVHTIQASTVEIKNKWVSEIKRVLFNQLEELKDEKNKQYGLNHKTASLQAATQWDPTATPPPPPPPMAKLNIQHAKAGLNVVSSGPIVTTTVGLENDNNHHGGVGSGGGAWSSDYSNSEDDEYTNIDENGIKATPGAEFLVLADYCATSDSEVSIKEGFVVELMKVGCAGWWFVKISGDYGSDEEELKGWVPAAYLSPTHTDQA